MKNFVKLYVITEKNCLGYLHPPPRKGKIRMRMQQLMISLEF